MRKNKGTCAAAKRLGLCESYFAALRNNSKEKYEYIMTFGKNEYEALLGYEDKVTDVRMTIEKWFYEQPTEKEAGRKLLKAGYWDKNRYPSYALTSITSFLFTSIEARSYSFREFKKFIHIAEMIKRGEL